VSEYQFYEFAAVDQPLTGQQQAELRSRSTRATITASSFVNEYHWGNLKGDPLDWVERYFDAHIYSANWGSCRLLLRLPRAIFDARSLLDYTGRNGRAAQSQFAKAFDAKTLTPAQNALAEFLMLDPVTGSPPRQKRALHRLPDPRTLTGSILGCSS
jgi:hypothetical protein